MPELSNLIEMLGKRTPWGKIAAIFPANWPAPGGVLGERFYMMVDKHGAVALQPADVVERVWEVPNADG